MATTGKCGVRSAESGVRCRELCFVITSLFSPSILGFILSTPHSALHTPHSVTQHFRNGSHGHFGVIARDILVSHHSHLASVDPVRKHAAMLELRRKLRRSLSGAG